MILSAQHAKGSTLPLSPPSVCALPGSDVRNMANVSDDARACGRVPPLTRHHLRRNQQGVC